MISLLKNHWFQLWLLLGVIAAAAIVYNEVQGRRYGLTVGSMAGNWAQQTNQSVTQGPSSGTSQPASSGAQGTRKVQQAVSNPPPASLSATTNASLTITAAASRAPVRPLVAPAQARAQLHQFIAEGEGNANLQTDDVAFERWRSRVRAYLETTFNQPSPALGFESITRSALQAETRKRLAYALGSLDGLILSAGCDASLQPNDMQARLQSFINDAEADATLKEEESVYLRWQARVWTFIATVNGDQAGIKFWQAAALSGTVNQRQGLGAGLGVLDSLRTGPLTNQAPIQAAPPVPGHVAQSAKGGADGTGQAQQTASARQPASLATTTNASLITMSATSAAPVWLSVTPAAARAQLQKFIADGESDSRLKTDELVFERWRSRVRTYLEAAFNQPSAALWFNNVTRNFSRAKTGLPLASGLGYLQGAILSAAQDTPLKPKDVQQQLQGFLTDAESHLTLKDDPLAYARWKARVCTFLYFALNQRAGCKFDNAAMIYGDKDQGMGLRAGMAILESLVTSLATSSPARQPDPTPVQTRAELKKFIAEGEDYETQQIDDVAFESWRSRVRAYLETAFNQISPAAVFDGVTRRLWQADTRKRLVSGLGCVDGIILSAGQGPSLQLNDVQTQLESFVKDAEVNASLKLDELAYLRWQTRVAVFISLAVGQQAGDQFWKAAMVSRDSSQMTALGAGLGVLDSLMTGSLTNAIYTAASLNTPPRSSSSNQAPLPTGTAYTIQAAAPTNEICKELLSFVQEIESNVRAGRTNKSDVLAFERWRAHVKSYLDRNVSEKAGGLFNYFTIDAIGFHSMGERMGFGMGSLEALIAANSTKRQKATQTELKEFITEAEENRSLRYDDVRLGRWEGRVVTYLACTFDWATAHQFWSAILGTILGSGDQHERRLAAGLGVLDSLFPRSNSSVDTE